MTEVTSEEASEVITEVTLADVLLNRERRVLRQRAVLESFGRPLLSITIVNPGPVKNSRAARQLMTQALYALDILIADRCWPILSREVRLDSTGPEALLVVDAGSHDLKQAATRLEDEHPFGRLWDVDVIDPLRGAISRRTLGLAPRRCLLCNEAAHVCVRSRSHPLQKIQQAIQEIIHAHREP